MKLNTKSAVKRETKTKRKTTTKKLPFWKRWTKRQWAIYSFVSFVGMLALFTLAVMLLFLYFSYGTNLPSVDSLKNYKPSQSIRITDRNGKFISFIGKKKRTVVSMERIPKILVHAITSAEDASFFKHGGLNYLGMVRAFWVNVMAGRFKQGGSTITQQVVKTLLLTRERTLRRKFQEVILARRVEATLTKEEILNIYLNEIYLGHGRYGVEEACRYYFGKHVWDINIAEAAMLAGLPQGPEYNSPIKHPKRAKARQNYVLRQMKKHGFISKKEEQEAIKTPLPLKKSLHKVEKVDFHHSYGVEMADFIKKKIKNDDLHLNGKEIVTTLDLNLQKSAAIALRKGLKAVDQRQHVTALKHLSVRKLNKHLKNLKSKGKIRSGPTYMGVVVAREKGKIIVDLGVKKGVVVKSFERYYPKGYRWNPPKEKKRKTRRKKHKRKHQLPKIRIGDLFPVVVMAGKSDVEGAPLRLKAELGPQGAVVVMSVKSRDILAMVGGYSINAGDFNRALRAKRQPGSSFKPFVYAKALESKKFTPVSLLNDGPEVYNKWIPRNHGKFFGQVTLRVALAKSINSIAVYLLKKVGVKGLVDLVKNSGISTPLHKDLSLALGSSEVTLKDMVSSYAIFPSGGIYREPRYVLKIGDDIQSIAPAKRVLNRDVAWLTLSLMKSVIKIGTGRRARKLRFPLAGKTGTTNRSRDAWFIGYTTEVVVGVWVGYDDHRPLGHHEEGARTALPIFINTMRVAMKGRKKRDFSIPPGIVSVLVDKKTGKAVFPGANSVTEYFLKGTEPAPPVATPVVIPEEKDDQDGDDDQNSEDLLTE